MCGACAVVGDNGSCTYRMFGDACGALGRWDGFDGNGCVGVGCAGRSATSDDETCECGRGLAYPNGMAGDETC